MANPNPTKRGPIKDKPFRDALRMEILAMGDNHKGLRLVARKLLDNAVNNDLSAIREIADRIDGKIPQAIVGDDEYDPIQVATDEDRVKALAVLLAKAAAEGGK
jgi:hypothetical protein